MIRALVRKELREMLPLLALAAILQLLVLIGATGQLPQMIDIFGTRQIMPFGNGDLCYWMTLIGVGLALLLGLAQTMWEVFRGTFHFLLHRPLPRTVLFGVKLAVGSLMCLTLTAVPLLLYAIWAVTPGSYPGPFEWSMTAPCWQLCLGVMLVYLSAFLSGLRPARWYASRFLPVALALLAVLIISVIPVWWGIKTGSFAALSALNVMAILYVAQTRDFS